MQLLAQTAMRGPLTAALVVAGLFFCSMLPVVLLGPMGSIPAILLMTGSLGMVALVVLRHGAGPGLQTSVLATVLIGLTSLLMGGGVGSIVLMAILSWVPVVLAAWILRVTVRLDLALLSLAGMIVVAVLFVFLVYGNPEHYWRELFNRWILANADQLNQSAREAGMVLTADIASQSERFAELMARMMTGAMAATSLVLYSLALLYARSMQARLFNPGGFQQEFQALSFGQAPAAIALGICGLTMVFPLPLLVVLVMVAITLFLLQGLAVAHALVRIRGMSSGWLIGVYAMLILIQTTVLLSALGMIDNWLRLRKR